MPTFTVPSSYGTFREYNQCHNPAGPGGGRFCSGKAPSLGRFARPEGSVRIPDYLKADVERAAQAGIVTYHHQQPEPVRDSTGQIRDPLALSHAKLGDERFVDAQTGLTSYAKGKVRIVTRGGEFEPDETVYPSGDYFRPERRKKTLTPDMLTDPATEEDILSTYRHEIGHLMDRAYGAYHKKSTPGTPEVLQKEIRAWQYAVEASPTHTVSQRMLRSGLESHAYYEFRRQTWLKQASTLRISSWDQAEWSARMVANELKENILVPETLAKAEQFTQRVMRAINNYGAVLRKRGKGIRTPKAPQPWFPKPTLHPGPGRGGII